MERVKAILQNNEPCRWLFYGDSITHGAKHSNGMRDFSELFRERVTWELQRSNDLVLNSAFSGFKTTDLLRDFDFRAAAFRPQAVFLMIGTNDSATLNAELYDQQLNELLKKFAAIGTLVILQTPPPVLMELSPERKNLPDFVQIIRQTAQKHQLPLIDHFEYWSNCPAAVYLYADILHPNDKGHIKIAHDIFKALGIFEQTNSRVCNFFTPKML